MTNEIIESVENYFKDKKQMNYGFHTQYNRWARDTKTVLTEPEDVFFVLQLIEDINKIDKRLLN